MRKRVDCESRNKLKARRFGWMLGVPVGVLDCPRRQLDGEQGAGVAECSK
jgi:hypothetical protein